MLEVTALILKFAIPVNENVLAVDILRPIMVF